MVKGQVLWPQGISRFFHCSDRANNTKSRDGGVLTAVSSRVRILRCRYNLQFYEHRPPPIPNQTLSWYKMGFQFSKFWMGEGFAPVKLSFLFSNKGYWNLHLNLPPVSYSVRIDWHLSWPTFLWFQLCKTILCWIKCF